MGRLTKRVSLGGNLSSAGGGQTAEGFTIIEVIFVLAIASTILLLVLQAIPALQRNGRNGRRKQDVAATLEAVSHWELTNSGNFPVYPATPGDVYLQYTKLSLYDPATIVSQLGVGPVGANTNPDTVQVYNRLVCDPTSLGGATDGGAGYNDVVALYAIETASGISSICQQL